MLAGDIPDFVVESRLLRKDGAPVWVRKSISTTPGDAGQPKWIIKLVEDVTERQNAEDQLRRLNSELEERVRDEVRAREDAQARLALSEKLSALGQLAGGVAHDFNNVIQAVIGGASIIQRRAGDPAILRFAEMIDEAARRGASVTRRLLSLARRDDLRAAPVNVAALLKGMSELLTHTLGATIEIKLDIAEGLPATLADRSQLETVLVNLATNARDAMRDGGVITISAASESFTSEPSAELSPGAYVRFDVSDTGVGMDKATLRRALEPFFTTKERGKGTGLGLSMACSFAEQSGGALKVHSQPGRGTIVKLWLPVAEAPTAQPEAREKAALSAFSGDRRVLLVDDETTVRDVLACELIDHGYDVIQAGSGASALVLIDAGEKVDLIISDFSMPGMDGLALIQAAQERHKKLPAILLTGYVVDDAFHSVGAATAKCSFTLLRKPVTGTSLADQIATLLEAAV
jgi:signal transduction histidine kinase